MSGFPGKQHVVPPPADPRPEQPIPSPSSHHCLLPDDDTAVERLAAALNIVYGTGFSGDVVYEGKAAAIIAALREGGQPE
jgi:hypothetical protein